MLLQSNACKTSAMLLLLLLQRASSLLSISHNNLSEQRQRFSWKGDTTFTLAAGPQVKRISNDPSWRRAGVCRIVSLNWSCSFLYGAADSPFGHWLKSDGHSSRAELDDCAKCSSNTISLHQSRCTALLIFRKYCIHIWGRLYNVCLQHNIENLLYISF